MTKKFGMRPCQCGATMTTQPLSICKPCDKCGQMLHNQYAIIYHPGPDGKGCGA